MVGEGDAEDRRAAKNIGYSFVYAGIRSTLPATGNTCPICQRPGMSLDQMFPNQKLRQAVEGFKKKYLDNSGIDNNNHNDHSPYPSYHHHYHYRDDYEWIEDDVACSAIFIIIIWFRTSEARWCLDIIISL